MKKLVLICLLVGANFSSVMQAQDKAAYRLFSPEGKKISYKKAIKKLTQADIICFGEIHNISIVHWLQYEMLTDLHAQGKLTAIGMEMLETHQARAIQSYLQGKTDRKTFEKDNDLWKNHATDYRPLMNFAKEHKLQIVATNVPRKYARIVSKDGVSALDVLPKEEKSLMVPIPFPIDYELPSYAAMADMIKGHGGSMKAENFIAAQALKDATMAHHILEVWKEGEQFYHINGSYHSDDHEGIVWHMKQAKPGLNILTISSVEQTSLDQLETEHKGKADIMLVVPESMTKTYVSDFE